MLLHATPSVFIGGLQRSGTSLLRGILGSHPELAIFPRDMAFWSLASKFQKKGLFWFLSQLQREPKIVASNMLFDMGRLLRRIDSKASFVDVVRGFLTFYAEQTSRSLYGHKMPGDERHADEIMADQYTVFVHMIRDPRDVFISQLSVKFGADVRKHILNWRNSADLAIENNKKFGSRYIVVRYEDLVADTERIVRQICVTAGLGFDPVMLEMQHQPLWIGANSAFADIGGWGDGQVSREIKTNAVGRFRDLMTTSTLEIFRELDMSPFGYE